MNRTIKVGLTALFSTLTLALLVTTLYRWTWDYNENGIHFDEESMTTYSDGAIGGYALLTVLFLIPTILLFAKLKK